ncbi:MAG TPA: YihY/virulence factor BrkB family protein [Burkholderiales bacterium]|nr:YihY/virulence factor BrkB family protein [Burkholderiales bacterium]
MSLRNDLRHIFDLGGLTVRELARRVIREMGEDEVSGYAAQLAYYFLFALFPFFIFLTALLGFIPIPDLLDRIMEVLIDFIPVGAAEIVEDNVYALVSQERGGLLSFGILLALWSASGAVAAITESLNRAYGVREGRPFWKARGTAILLTVGLAAMIILSMVLLVVGPGLIGPLADMIGLGPVFKTLWLVLRWPIVLTMMILAIAVVFYLAPDVEQQWRWITPGAIFAVLMWLAVSALFGFYVENFAEYNKTYGSIGAVIVLLMWMYLSGLSLLIGGEINSEIEHAAPGGKDEGEKKIPHRRLRRARA